MASVPTTLDPASTQPATARVDRLIDQRIEEASAALWQAEWIKAVLQLTCGISLVLLSWILLDHWFFAPGPWLRLTALVLILCCVVAYLYWHVLPLFRTRIRSEYAARSLERDLPQLRQSLLSYLTLRSHADDHDGLRASMIRSLGAHTAARLQTHTQLPSEALGTMKWWLAAIGSVVLLLLYTALSPKNGLQSAQRLVAPLANIAAPRRVEIRDVQPGDIDTLAGNRIEVSAVIKSMSPSDQAVIRWLGPTSHGETELKLDEVGKRFVGAIELDHFATGSVSYELHAGDATAGPYVLRVQDVPVIVSQLVHYEPPSYTLEKPYTRSGGSISALSGTIITIQVTTNRPVAKARIEFNPRAIGDQISATAGARDMTIKDATDVSLTVPLRSRSESKASVDWDSYRIQLWDAAGHSSPSGVVHPIRIIEDLPPEVVIVTPQVTPKDVPIDAQQMIEVHANDPDFGLALIELELRRGIDVLANPILWKHPTGAAGHLVAEFAFRPSEHKLRVGDVVSIVAVATDNRLLENDPAIEPNRSRTDPIQLKITMGGTPSGNQKQNDGLSSDNRTSSSDNQDGAGNDGSKSGATGGSGSSGSGQGSSSSGSGAGQGEGQSSNNSEDKSGAGTGESTSGSSEPNSKPNGDRSGAGDTPPSGNRDGGKNSANQTPDGTDSHGTMPEPNRPDRENTTPQDGNASSGAGGNASNPTKLPDDPSQAKQGEPANSETGTGAAGRTETDANQTAKGQPNQGKPNHDGEAFERIRDYLNEQQGDRSQNESGSQSNPSQDSSRPSNDSNRTPQSPFNTKDRNGEDQNQSAPSDSSKDQSGAPKGSENKSAKKGSNQGQGEGTSNKKPDQGPGSNGEKNASSPNNGNNSLKNSDAQKGTVETRDSQTPPTGQPAGADDSSEKALNGDPTSNDSLTEESSQSKGSPSNAKPKGSHSKGEGQDRDKGSGDDHAKDNLTGDGNGTNTSNKDEPSGSPDGKKADEPGRDNASSSKSSPGGPSTVPEQSSNEESSKDGPSQGTGQNRNSIPNSSGESQSGSSSAVDPTTKVDAPDLEYTKQATDLVLDYLKETRDAPDKELLERLDWTPEEMRAFSDRWQTLKRSDASRDEAAIRESLESLGMRPQRSVTESRSLRQDQLSQLRDSGLRTLPPRAYRDAFDAFRRAAAKSGE